MSSRAEGRCFSFHARDHLTKFLYLLTEEAEERESAALEVGEDILNSALAHSLSHRSIKDVACRL